jgi:Flp pilus assembly protein CpaB
MALSSDLKRLSLPHLDRRTLLGIGLAAAAAVLVLLITRPTPTTPVLVAGSDLPAGPQLGSLDITVREVEDASGLVTGDTLGDLSEWSLKVPLSAGEPLLPSVLQPPQVAAASSLLAIELDAAHAVLGQLAAGDEVDVYFTATPGPGEIPTTTRIAESVYIVDAALTESSIGAGRVDLLLAVDEDLAATLTAAMHTGDLDLVRVGP